MTTIILRSMAVKRLVSLWERHPGLDVAFANQYESTRREMSIAKRATD